MSSLEETTIIKTLRSTCSIEELKRKLNALEEEGEKRKEEREKLKDKRPISVLTDYPLIYGGTYWGKFQICYNKPSDENINNRNNFIKDYDIVKRVEWGKRPDFICKIVTRPCNFLDHIEVYKRKDGQYVVVSSPNDETIKEHLDDGWTQIYPLYFRSPSFIKITNYSKYKQSIKKPGKRLKNEVWKLCNGDNFEGKCFCCNEVLYKPDSHYGYIKPIRNGGETSNSNLKTICERCCWQMGESHMYFWMKEEIKRIRDDDEREMMIQRLRQIRYVSRYFIDTL